MAIDLTAPTMMDLINNHPYIMGLIMVIDIIAITIAVIIIHGGNNVS